MFGHARVVSVTLFRGFFGIERKVILTVQLKSSFITIIDIEIDIVIELLWLDIPYNLNVFCVKMHTTGAFSFSPLPPKQP